MLKGLDVASIDENKNIDWTKPKEIGFSFGITRAAWGTTKDSIYDAEQLKLQRSGYVRGAYLYLRFSFKGKPAPSPTDQARTACAIVGKLPQDCFPPTIDIEFPGNGASDTHMTPAALISGIMDAWDVFYGFYGVAPMAYSSDRVIVEDLDDKPFPARMLKSPLWLKYYPFNPGPAVINPPESLAPPPVPAQWNDPSFWFIHQFQGDATGVPGFTSTVDLNRFNPMSKGASGERVKWVQTRLGVTVDGKFGPNTDTALRRFQTAKGLTSDGIIGPKTFAYLCWVPV